MKHSTKAAICMALGVGLMAASFADAEIASWYGNELRGSVQANGEPFDPNKLTAASKTLPLGTRLLVKHEGRGVSVEVTDRGPFTPERDLDISQAAAETIGIEDEGVTAVEVSVVESPAVEAEVLPDTGTP